MSKEFKKHAVMAAMGAAALSITLAVVFRSADFQSETPPAPAPASSRRLFSGKPMIPTIPADLIDVEPQQRALQSGTGKV